MAVKDFQKVLDSNISVTEHFRLYEFFRSETADSTKLTNFPHTWIKLSEVLTNIDHVARFLEYARQMLKKPIVITSGYRCPELNKLVGGVFNSAHMDGLAVDISCDDMSRLHAICLRIVCSCYNNYQIDYINWNKEKSYIHIEFNKFV